MNGKEAYDKIFDKLTYDQQQELGDQVLRTVYQDLNRLEKLEKENQELKNTILSLELDTCIPELRKENTQLKNIIKILDREFIFKTTNITNIVYIECEYSKGKFTKKEYKLLKEVFENA